MNKPSSYFRRLRRPKKVRRTQPRVTVRVPVVRKSIVEPVKQAAPT